MKKIIGCTTVYTGTEHRYLNNYKVKIVAILKNAVLAEGKGYNPDAEDAYITDNEYLINIGGVTANDRIEVQPFIEKEGRYSWVSSDPKAVDLKMFDYLLNAKNANNT